MQIQNRGLLRKVGLSLAIAGTIAAGAYALFSNKYNCSRFARLEAEKRFGIRYKPANAWDRKYVDDVTELNGRSLEQMFDDGDLQPGMMVALLNPKSDFLKGNDKLGNPREYTHIALCLGKDTYIQDIGGTVSVVNEAQLRKKFVPKQVLAARGN